MYVYFNHTHGNNLVDQVLGIKFMVLSTIRYEAVDRHWLFESRSVIEGYNFT